MKKIIPYLFFAFVFASCEVIEGPYMSGNINPIDTSNNNYVKNMKTFMMKKMNTTKKLVVILGPTACGKTIRKKKTWKL